MKSKKLLGLTVISMVIFLILPGCSSSNPTPRPGEPPQLPPGGPQPQPMGTQPVLPPGVPQTQMPPVGPPLPSPLPGGPPLAPTMTVGGPPLAPTMTVGGPPPAPTNTTGTQLDVLPLTFDMAITDLELEEKGYSYWNIAITIGNTSVFPYTGNVPTRCEGTMSTGDTIGPSWTSLVTTFPANSETKDFLSIGYPYGSTINLTVTCVIDPPISGDATNSNDSLTCTCSNCNETTSGSCCGGCSH